MGSTAHKDSPKRSVQGTISPETSDPIDTPDFANGELGQLQEILYGAQQRATNVQITTLQNQINEQIETLSNMLNSRLNLLTESIEKKSTTQEQKLNELQSDVEKANTQLQTQISDTRDALQVEIQSSVDRLQNNKLDRKNLAQLLGDVSRELGASVSDVSK